MQSRLGESEWRNLWGSLWLLISILGCHAGGGITASPPPPAPPSSKVDVPTVAAPSVSPYYSKDNSVTVQGMCQTGETVILSGDDHQEVSCTDARYALQISKAVDGIYSFQLMQRDQTQSLSEQISFVWIRKTSVPPPNITKPTTTNYASAKQELIIEGNCESGSLVALTGDGVGYTTCLNSQFALSLPKSIDGDYQVGIQQTDLAGNSAATSLTWRKHAIALNPGNASVVVNTSYTFTVSGGTGFYDMTLSQNNSGGSFVTTTRTYTSGTIANSLDTLRVTDSEGSILDFQMLTVPGIPDHLILNSSTNPPSQLPGVVSSNAIKVHLVDRYGNGIASFPLSFKIVSGEASLVGNPLQVTDTNGDAQIFVLHGYQAFLSRVSVGPTTGVLPDLAGSGNATLQVSLSTDTTNSGNLGALYATGSNPGAMTVSDFNGDGLKDIAVLNVGDTTVGIAKGKPGGMLGLMSNFPMNCNAANGIASGDVNHDSKQDLIVSCGGDNTVVYLQGAGDGTFGIPQIISAPAGQEIPMDVKLIDWNNDAHLDITIVSNMGNVFAIWLGDGAGNFTPEIQVTVGSSPTSFAINDLNKDGLKDIVVANSADATLGVVLQTSANSFSAMVSYPVDVGPIQVFLADLDGDTYADAIVCNNGANSITVWMNDHGGGFQNDSLWPVGGSPTGLFVGDIDGNNKVDIVAVNSGDDSLSVILNRGGGVLESLATLSILATPLNIMGGDFNGDLINDLVINSGNQRMQIVPGKSDGLGYTSATKLGPTEVGMGDWNGDGMMDAAVLHTGASEVAILIGQGNGLFSEGTALTGVMNARSLLSGDWNKDNKIDLVVSLGGTSSVRVYLGKGDGAFEAPVDYAVGSGPLKMVSADFNSDGSLDLAVVCQTANSVTVLLGNGDGTFSQRRDLGAGSGPSAIAFGDINGDNIVDLAVSVESNSNVGVLIGNGDGSFQTVLETAVGIGPIGVALQDFNGDGALDVATLNGADGSVSVLLGNGDGSLRAKNDFACGLSPLGMVTGDFDSNGRLDVALTNSSDQKVTVLLNTGNGTLSDQLVFDAKSSLGGLGISDLNNDGSLDLIATETNNNRLQIWVGH